MRRTFQRFTALLAFALLCFVTAAAQEIIVDSLKYTLNTSDHTASLSGYVAGIKNANIPQTITSDGAEFKVTSLGEYCFEKCKSLTSINIPKGVTSLGYWSFYNCTNLTNVIIPEGVTSLDYGCFEGCTSLTSVTLPESLTSLPNSCFRNCTSLASITLPKGVTSLGWNCFDYCEKLTHITLPEGLTSIGLSCFYYCNNLVSITIPESVKTLESNCFQYCVSLTSVTLPDSITSIDSDCFGSVGTSNPCKLYISDKFDTKLLGAAGSTYSIGGGNFVVPVQSLTLSSDKLFVIKGRPFQPAKATIVPAAANNKKLNLISDNTSVVSIENGDSIVLSGAGETDVRYEAADGFCASAVCHVTVKLPTDSVRTNISKKDFLVGQTYSPTVTIYPGEAIQKFRVSSSNPQVAAVDSTGTITTLALGEADIRYEAYDNSEVFALLKVRVFEKTGSIALDNRQQVLLVNNTYKPTISISPAAANQEPVATSSNPQVATVDSTGTVTAVGPGEAEIRYEAFDNSELSATLHVTVYAPADTIELGEKELHLLVGDHNKLNVSVLPQTAMQKWTTVSSDSTVAVVNEDSVIVAKGWGECDIKYETTDGTKKTAKCHVYVTYPTDSLKLNTTVLNTNPGKVFKAQQVTYYPENCRRDLKYTSSNEQVATVDSLTGAIMAVAAGEADVRYEAKDGTGKYAVCHVKVWPLTESLTPSSTTLTLKMGEEYNQQTVAILPSGAYPKLKMTSEDDSVATVDENGVIKAVGLGVTNIVYQAMDSSRVEGTCQVRVILKDSDFFAINSKETWEKFCALIDGGYTTMNAKMTADVALDPISSMAGAKQVYAGHFDGLGHTLTVNYIGTAQATAPFAQAGGAVIENLKTAGTIKQTGTNGGYPQSHASGLVGKAFGVTINNCEVAVAISFTLTGKPDQHSGGFVGHGHGMVITMNNCKFSGSFTAPDGSQTSGIAGLVGWSAGTGSSFTNCYVAGTYKNIVDVHPLVYTYWKDNPTVSSSNNYYYFNGIGASTWSTYGTATAVTADSVRNGSVTYALQRGAEAKGWSQNLPDETEPMLAYSDAKTVNKVEFVYNDTVKFIRYANMGSTIPGGLPTLSAKDILGSDYNERHYYETSYTPDFTDATVVTGDSIIKMGLDDYVYFTVNSKAAWEKFCALVNGGNNKLDVMMTEDVTDAVTTMAGSMENQYQGTFDGDGHTLNVNLSGGQNVAPFPVASNATIENLRVTGTIAASAKYAAGIVGNVVVGQPTTISGCESNVTINSTVSGDGTHGGIVGATSNNGYVVISNCAFMGVMNGAETNNCGGFIGWAGTGAAKSSISNSLVAATFNTGTEGSYTFTRNPGQVDITNCYYLNAYGTAQGTLVTDEQLKNGYVASKLQADQDDSYWAFYLGGRTILRAFYSYESEENQKYNFVYFDEYIPGWRCDHYHLTDGEAYQDTYVKFRADQATYLRSLSADRCYTWCLPYTLTYSEDMPFKAYRLKGYTNGNAVFAQLGNGNLLYGFNPYLIVMKESRDSIDYDTKTYVNPCSETLGYVPAGDIKMMGTVKTISNSEASKLGAYIMQNDNSWRKVMADQDATAYIPPFRAYLTVDGSAAGAKIGSVLSDETTTGVENIILKDNDGTTHIYDLRGMDRGTDFDSLPTGVYIRGGKKVVKR